ncbi:hypothetical protein B0H13DRAFT_1654647, partial [Mycena leptocephala]
MSQQTPSSDKRAEFWTAYKNLANESAGEFQTKYGSDLDASLIFAGLFSAVSSAFIIQIQPALQTDPNAITQSLLVALFQNVTGNITAAGIQMQPPAGPPLTILVSQGLLYFSLFSSLLAALLAVLGKQW